MVNPAPNPKGGAYLLYGKEEFLKREFLQKLRADLFPKNENLEMGFCRFEAPANSVSALIDFAGSPSFFSTKRLAVFSGIDEFEDDEKERLLAYTQHVPSGVVLVLISEESSVKKDHFLRRLSENARATPCHLPFEKDLPQWIEGRARKYGKTIERDAAALLIERVGKDAALLHSAVEQLTVYAHKETRISLRNAETLLGRSVQADVFGLIDALLEKKIRLALEFLEVLIREGTKIYEIVGAFSGQLERLGKIRALIEEGFPQDTIVEELKLHPFFAAKILKQAEKISKDRIQKMLKSLLYCDEIVKTGRLGEKLALQHFVVKACLD